MAIVCYEHAESGGLRITSRGAQLPTRWVVHGTADRILSYEAVLAETPITFGGLVRSEVNATEQGGGNWIWDVVYSTIDPNSAVGVSPTEPQAPSESEPLLPTPGQGSADPGQPFVFDFDISEQQVHITQSLETRHSEVAAGQVEKDFKQAIGWDGERINGVDISTPGVEFSIKVERAVVNLLYIKKLRRIACTTNNGPWWGFEEGDVLYLGGAGSYTQGGRWSITHKFRVGIFDQGPFGEGIDIGNGIVIPDKRAWEYLWVRYGDDAAGGAMGQVPIQALVERVYRTSNFADLELGV